MPRSQKNRHRGHKKHKKTVKKTERLVGAQATVSKEHEYPSSSSASIKGIPHGSIADTSSNNQGARGTSSTTKATVSLGSKSGEDKKSSVKERAKITTQITKKYTNDALDEMVVTLVHYMLHKYQMKEPITKASLLRNITQAPKRHIPEILSRVFDHIELVFGLDIKEVEPNRHIYVLVNKLKTCSDKRLADGRVVPKSGLLMTLLGVIFTKGNCATEEQIWQVLNRMGFHDGKKHFLFGEPRKLITREFVKERYLQYEQVANSYPPRYQFLWGPKAHAETTKMEVLQFLSKIHETVPIAFPSLYVEALIDQEERSKSRVAAKDCTAPKTKSRCKAKSRHFTCPR
ncbi:melanoma-associated antigen B10-like [Perognathus longimembris pacificus]|uniref:melanoma-associated antigen B10-like n=1 Tax=Perognathus longimembris pacificus TaxID=214514 RepID=UPI002018E9DB|nr:melanoma-associated antigen B10-like [Perognathus longimembris pacificus]